MIRATPKATVALCVFFVLVFIIAFTANPYYPVRVIAGEASVGTWMSGVLLVISATTALAIAMRTGNLFWYTIAAFFILLALDERFMFHEQLKEAIKFSIHNATPRWLYELPAIAGACIGAVVAYRLWHRLRTSGRKLLLIATALGSISVAMDVLAAGVLWEESCKLLAELSITCALIGQVESGTGRL